MITGSQATLMALEEAMELDPTVLLLGEDIADEEGGGVMKATKGLSTRFGTHRVRSTPISEQAIVGAAVGAAIAGFRPVAEIMLMNFITVAMDQIVNHAAKIRYMSGGKTGAHKIDGIGAGYVVPLWRPDIADMIERVSTEDATAMALRLAHEEGLFAGTSTGANVIAALRLAERLAPGASIVTVMCDTGMKYLKSFGALEPAR